MTWKCLHGLDAANLCIPLSFLLYMRGCLQCALSLSTSTPCPIVPSTLKITLPPFYSSLLRPLQSSRFSPAITSSLTPGFPQHLGLDISLPSSWRARAVFCISVSLVSLFSSWTGLRKACGMNGWMHEVGILFSLSKKKWMGKSHYTLLRVLDYGWAKVLPL